MYEGIQTEVIRTTRFDENSDLSITYLGTTKASKIKAEERFLTLKQSYMIRWNKMSDTIGYRS